jgi:hypothetical protein
MGNSFLEEQLERVKRLTEWMAQIHSEMTENSALISRDRETRDNRPFQGIRDYRTLQSPEYETPEADDRTTRRPRPRSEAPDATPARPRRKRR